MHKSIPFLNSLIHSTIQLVDLYFQILPLGICQIVLDLISFRCMRNDTLKVLTDILPKLLRLHKWVVLNYRNHYYISFIVWYLNLTDHVNQRIHYKNLSNWLGSVFLLFMSNSQENNTLFEIESRLTIFLLDPLSWTPLNRWLLTYNTRFWLSWNIQRWELNLHEILSSFPVISLFIIQFFTRCYILESSIFICKCPRSEN